MASFIVEGGHRLHGSITPAGAKNEALQVLSAVLLTSAEVVIDNLPDILDVNNLIDLLAMMGVRVQRDGKRCAFCAEHIDTAFLESPDFLHRCNRLRGSVMLIGPLLARLGKVHYSKPGGDQIGRRRLDTHFQGLHNRRRVCLQQGLAGLYLYDSRWLERNVHVAGRSQCHRYG